MPDLFSFSPSIFPLNDKYLLTIYKGISSTKIKMSCSSGVLNTSQIPYTINVLQQTLPSIFKSKCFNDNNYPFLEEVKSTEIAHLFEHIMLEYICIRKIARGDKSVSVSGTTDWNWKREAHGTFNITIRIGRNEQEVFDEALAETSKLFAMLVSESDLRKKRMTAF